MAEQKKTINIMHISDIHCGMAEKKSAKYRQERKEILRAFYEDFTNIPIEWRPNIVAITGDLGWIGCAKDYEEFNEFLQELCEKADIMPEKIICCPGNHDKYLPKKLKFPAEIKETSDYHSINDICKNLKPLAARFRNYTTGVMRAGIQPLINDSKLKSTKYLYGYRIIDGICFVVLNSAWLCDWRKDDKTNHHPNADMNNLMLDCNIVCSIFEKVMPNQPIVVMYHHPNEWLKNIEIRNENDRPWTTVDRINQHADITLNGHIHHAREIHSRERLHYIAGTISSDDVYESECNILRINVNESDKKFSCVDEGRYYLKWGTKGVSWIFEEGDADVPFNISVEREQTRQQILHIRSEIQKCLKDAGSNNLDADIEKLMKQLFHEMAVFFITNKEDLQELFNSFWEILCRKAYANAEENATVKFLVKKLD